MYTITENSNYNKIINIENNNNISFLEKNKIKYIIKNKWEPDSYISIAYSKKNISLLKDFFEKAKIRTNEFKTEYIEFVDWDINVKLKNWVLLIINTDNQIPIFLTFARKDWDIGLNKTEYESLMEVKKQMENENIPYDLDENLYLIN